MVGSPLERGRRGNAFVEKTLVAVRHVGWPQMPAAGRSASREVRDARRVERKSWKRNGNGLSGLRRRNVRDPWRFRYGGSVAVRVEKSVGTLC